VEYRIRRRERSYTLGRVEAWDLKAAREEARRIVRQTHDGVDPLADRDAPTVAKMAEKYVAEELPKLRPSSRADYERIVKIEIVPALGKLRCTDVTTDDVARLHRKITERAPYRANRVKAVLSAMFNVALRQWRWVKENPCRSVRSNAEHGRERFLQNGEVARLLEAFDRLDDQTTADMLRLLLLTGARRNEIVMMQQEHVIDGVWTRPATATKQKKASRIPLSAQAQVILARQPWTGSGPVFPGSPVAWRGRLRRAWDAVCRDAGITGMRLHDLRHSYASTLANMGVSLQVVGKLLGHSKMTTTQRYSHLYDETLRVATERAGDALSAARNSPAKIMPIKKGA
jgi:integrase